MNDFNDVSIFIVTSKKEIIPCENYTYFNKNDKCIFIMLTNDRLNSEYGDDNSIFIGMDYLSGINDTKIKRDNLLKELSIISADRFYDHIRKRQDDFIWSYKNQIDFIIDKFDTEEDVKQDFDGYQHTIDILTYAPRHQYKMFHGNYLCMFPAISAAYHVTINLNGDDVHGFLPSLGQLYIINYNEQIIFDVCSKILKHRCSQYLISNKWYSSSSLKDNEKVWFMLRGEISNAMLNRFINVFPIFSVKL